MTTVSTAIISEQSESPVLEQTASEDKFASNSWESLIESANLRFDTLQLAQLLLDVEKRGDVIKYEMNPKHTNLRPQLSSSTNSSQLSSSSTIPQISRAPSPLFDEPLPIEVSFPSTPGLGLKILCLDGGGIRGLSTLQILDHLQTIMINLGCANVPPCQVFDMICGTSTGGLIAIMLGRMGMTIIECIKLYKLLAKKIFDSMLPERAARYFSTDARLDSGILEKMIKKVILARLDSEDAPMVTTSPYGCKTFVVTVLFSAMDKADPILVRSYDTPSAKADTCPIYEAARATSAAPTWFTPQAIDGKLYIDGGIGHNNPTLLAMREIKALWPNKEIDAIISIGTGTKENISAAHPKRACIGYTTSSHAVHSAMMSRYGQGPHSPYFRFDVPNIGTSVGLGDWDKLSVLDGETSKYLLDPEVKSELQRCAKRFRPIY